MVNLVESVSEKMKGFSRKETVDYYKDIMERAWEQVEAADTPEVKSQKFDEAMEWTMLDKDYDDRTQRTFRGPVFVPIWWGRYDPTFRPALAGQRRQDCSALDARLQARRVPHSLPGADFAASVVGGVQTFSAKVIGDLNTFTSRVTNVTNPPPKPSVGSSSRWRRAQRRRVCLRLRLRRVRLRLRRRRSGRPGMACPSWIETGRNLLSGISRTEPAGSAGSSPRPVSLRPPGRAGNSSRIHLRARSGRARHADRQRQPGHAPQSDRRLHGLPGPGREGSRRQALRALAQALCSQPAAGRGTTWPRSASSWMS